MQDGWITAVVGATGLVGREMLAALAARRFPVAGPPRALARQASVGSEVDFGGQALQVAEARPEALANCDLVLMAAGEEASRSLAPAAAAAGAVVVDNSPAWRQDPGVPLVVPEVNAALLHTLGPRRIVANPNCTAIQLAVALAPLCSERRPTRVVISSYQSASGCGQSGVDELGEQVSALWRHQEPAAETFSERLAFNLLPAIGAVDSLGVSAEEDKVARELAIILEVPTLEVVATCVRVPTFFGHGAAVVVDFAEPVDPAWARARLAAAPGVVLADSPGAAGAGPALQRAQGIDAVVVGRVRQPPAGPCTLALWCVADNVRKGAAVNAVQIAEVLARRALGRAS